MRRIITNTLIMWLRTGIITILSIFSTRLTLSSLGANEFGIFLIGAGVGLFLGVLAGSIMTVSLRSLSMAAERNDLAFTKLVVGACLKNHMILVGLFLILGEILGHVALVWVLNIPSARLTTAIYVLHFTIMTGALGIIGAFYEVFLFSKEKFLLYSFINIANSVLGLLIALSLPYVTGDRLLFYAAAVSASNGALTVTGILVVIAMFPETRTLPSLGNNQRVGLPNRGIFYWNSLVILSYVGQQQGLSYLLFYFFGPAMATSLAVASQIAGLFRQIAQAVNNALAPGLYRMEAAGSRREMIEKSLLGSKYVFFLVCLALIPVWVEMPLLLRTWLASPPEGSVLMGRALLASLALELLSAQILTAWQAIGRTARLFFGSATVTALSLLACLLAGISNGSVETVAIIIVMTGIANSILRVVLMEPYGPGISRRWFLKVLLPGSMAIVPPATSAILISSFMPPNYLTASVVFIVCLIVGGSSALWTLGDDAMIYIRKILASRKFQYTLS